MGEDTCHDELKSEGDTRGLRFIAADTDAAQIVLGLHL